MFFMFESTKAKGKSQIFNMILSDNPKVNAAPLFIKLPEGMLYQDYIIQHATIKSEAYQVSKESRHPLDYWQIILGVALLTLLILTISIITFVKVFRDVGSKKRAILHLDEKKTDSALQTAIPTYEKQDLEVNRDGLFGPEKESTVITWLDQK